MSQRASGYERNYRDLYETPEWATKAVVPYLPPKSVIFEPACGSGKMLRALRETFDVTGDDLEQGQDFLLLAKLSDKFTAVVTNPPYNLATEFVEHSLSLTWPHGVVAMLLRTDFDHAKTRAHLFAKQSAFQRKVVLTKRIVWFESEGRKASPSFNHAWFIWDWRNTSPAVLSYDLQ